MKVGIRKPSIKKSISARTTGRAKRAVKKAVVPGYGKKGTGWIKDPKKAAYNKIYNKTTISVKNLANSSNKRSSSSNSNKYNANRNNIHNTQYTISQQLTRAKLINSKGTIKNCKVGFSWTSLFFMYFVPLSRLDFKNFLIQILTLSITATISPYLMTILWLVYAATYNKSYIKRLIKKGYYPYDKDSSDLLSKRDIYFDENDDMQKETISDLACDSNLANNSFTNYIDYDKNNNLNNEELYIDYFEDEDNDISLDDFGINITMSINGKEIINNDIKVNDTAPKGYHKFLDYEKVVGVTFENRDILVEKFINGSNRKITLIKDPLNEYDPFAIKVMGSCNYNGKFEDGQLGFLDKNIARKLNPYENIKATVNAVSHPNKIRIDIWVLESDYENIKELNKRLKQISKNEKSIYEYIDKGSNFEYDKNIDKAIEFFEKAIALDCDGNYPYDRLAILYRKKKDYENEIRVLTKAIEVFEFLGKVSPRTDIYPKLDKFKERLSKAEHLKLKNLETDSKPNSKLPKENKTVKKITISKEKHFDSNLVNYDRIISLDFETANNKRASVCSIGYVVEENNKIIKEEEIIVNPKAEFSNINVKIHRIKDVDVQDAPTWNIVWKQIEEYITDSTLVIAHNLKSMELSCIRQECERYNMDLPLFAKVKDHNNMTCDTLQMARENLPDLENYKLDTLAKHFNIELDHHNALSDAKACLNLFHHLRGDYATNE